MVTIGLTGAEGAWARHSKGLYQPERVIGAVLDGSSLVIRTNLPLVDRP